MAKKRKTKGLGDTVEKVFEATGIAKVAKFVLGDDCGCDDRKEKLNNWFPYKKVNCLNEDEYNYLTAYFTRNREVIRVEEQIMLLTIYNRVFNLQFKPTGCANCWREIHADLAKVFETYKEENG